MGWIGTAGVLLAYGLLSVGIIAGETLLYHFLMLVGSVGLAIITYHRKTYQPLVVNVVFSILALTALVRLLFLA